MTQKEVLGLSWPLPAEVTDAALEARLFADACTKRGHRRQVEPDWATIHRELKRKRKRKHVTLSDPLGRVHRAPSGMGLAHRDRELGFPDAVQLAEAGVACRTNCLSITPA
jgi:hypothetical protein